MIVVQLFVVLIKYILFFLIVVVPINVLAQVTPKISFKLVKNLDKGFKEKRLLNDQDSDKFCHKVSRKIQVTKVLYKPEAGKYNRFIVITTKNGRFSSSKFNKAVAKAVRKYNRKPGVNISLDTSQLETELEQDRRLNCPILYLPASLPIVTVTPSPTPIQVVTPTAQPTQTVTASPTPTPTATTTPNFTVVPTPSASPSLEPIVTPTPDQPEDEPSLVDGAIVTNLALLSVTSNSININWTNNAPWESIDWFRIERALGVTGAFIEAGEVFPSVSGENTTYSDNCLQPSTLYRYRVKIKFHDVSGYSQASNVLTVSTQSGNACLSTPSPTASATPVPFPINQLPALSTLDNQLAAQSLTTESNLPVQIGRYFMQSEIQNYPQVLVNNSALLTQADVKNRWPDGSVKFAVLSFVIPTINAQTPINLSFQDQLSGHNTNFLTQSQMLATNYDFDASIELTNSQSNQTISASARAMLAAGHFSYWLTGEVATSVIIADHSAARSADIGFDANKSFRPIFIATFYPSINKVKLRFIGENANTESIQDLTSTPVVAVGSPSPTPYLATLTLKTGLASPSIRYTQNYSHHAQSRWTKEFWLANQPANLVFNHNMRYLVSTGAIPAFDYNAPISQTAITNLYNNWLNSDRSINGAGLWTKSMGAGGDRPEIGYFPLWHVLWLATGDNRTQEIALGSSDLAAAWPMHLREGRNAATYTPGSAVSGLGKPVSVFYRPSLYSGNLINNPASIVADRVTPTGPVTNNGWSPDGGAHQPDPWTVAYLLTGDYFYLEQLQFWSAWGTLRTIPGTSSSARGLSLASLSPQGGAHERTVAWLTRTRMHAASFSPDASAEKWFSEMLLRDQIEIHKATKGLAQGSYSDGYNTTPAYNQGLTTGDGSCKVDFDPTDMQNPATGAAYTIANIPCGPLQPFYLGNSGISSGSNVNINVGANAAVSLTSDWMNAYLIVTFSRLLELGYDQALPLVDYVTYNPLIKLTDVNSNPYLLFQYRYPTVKAIVGQNGSLTFQAFQTVAEAQSAFTIAAQNSLSFDSTSPNANPNDAGFYTAVVHAAIISALRHHQNQNLVISAKAVWDSLYLQSPSAPSYSQTFYGGSGQGNSKADLRWSFICNAGSPNC